VTLTVLPVNSQNGLGSLQELGMLKGRPGSGIPRLFSFPEGEVVRDPVCECRG
jgi:hypothetical protein